MIKTLAIIKNAEVRGVEKKRSKKGNDYLVVKIDDETGERSELMDKDISREEYYKRGTVGDFTIKLDISKFANVEVKDFKITK